MPTRTDSSPCSILVITPSPEDHQTLDKVLGDFGWEISIESAWPRVATSLRQTAFQLVLCESDLPPATWKDVLAEIQRLSPPPFLIVVSLLADERLWAEALNLGAYDVLSKPFVDAEVRRVLQMAWLHWKYQHEIAKPAPLSRRASA